MKFITLGLQKQPPPHNITIYKGSTHVVALREFVEFVHHSKIGKDFIEFLKDTAVPDETVYASFQQHPLAREESAVSSRSTFRELCNGMITIANVTGPGYDLFVGFPLKICAGCWDEK